MNSDWSMRWVQSRIIPSSRQNIGEILRVNGMRSYDEHKLLLKNEGRSCQDEFYIEHMWFRVQKDFTTPQNFGLGEFLCIFYENVSNKKEESCNAIPLYVS